MNANTGKVTGKLAVKVIKVTGHPFQTALDRDGWLVPRGAVADVVRVARRLGGSATVDDPTGVVAGPDQLSFDEADQDETAPDWQRGPGPSVIESPSRFSAIEHADPAYVKAVATFILNKTATGDLVSADDVREAVPEGVTDAAALGGIFSQLASRGMIVAAGYGASRSPSRRGGAVRLWRGRVR